MNPPCADKETLYATALQALPGLGAIGLSRLYQRFGSFAEAWHAGPSALPKASRCTYAARQAPLAEAEQTLQNYAKQGIETLHLGSEAYPRLLAEIADPPALLYIRGPIELLSLPQIAVVGSRQHTNGGAKLADEFAAYLASAGFTITSGMALGIDSAAHRGALRAGHTIGVLGTGPDISYPRSNGQLYQQALAQGGLLVSEFQPGTPPRAGNFPQRNRIISGLSLGVLVVEAALRSGSLITARLAMEQGREVFAIPGSIHNPLSRGCHKLIREGATLVESAADIVDQLGAMLSLKAEEADTSATLRDRTVPTGSETPGNLGADARLVLDAMGFDPIAIDALIALTGQGAATLSAQLSELEIHGWVEQSAGRYQRLR